jgi:hypothetical protein
MAVPIAEGADSHRRVDPSTSVNKNVTVPDGAPTSIVSHAATRLASEASVLHVLAAAMSYETASVLRSEPTAADLRRRPVRVSRQLAMGIGQPS